MKKPIDRKLLALVKRPTLDKRGHPALNDKGEQTLRAVKAEEVLDYSVRPAEGTVTVVTVDGHKFVAELPEGWVDPSETKAPAGAATK